ncbi:hypothetical protein SAMN04487831_11744 [Pseudobutyrivibrio sp. UC1225]|nr:hypothetical protein SAMN04487831_11744 [Pseudobutyrivibrio sp. UC1225]
MISSITKVIKQSDMSDLNLISVVVRPNTIVIDNGNFYRNEELFVSDVIGASKAQLSEAWVAGNILLFTAFDGYLENKYSLTEGESFKNHYDNIPCGTEIELIEKDCYRILKLIRNGIQHNLSNVVVNRGSYSISYSFRGTPYSLQIDAWAMRYLYTIIMNLIGEGIQGLFSKYSTDGHYMGIMNTMYAELRAGITQISDDIGAFVGAAQGTGQYDAEHLRYIVRHPVVNPIIVSEDDNSIVFRHIECNGTDDETQIQYQYSTDYVYNDYLLPQEMGVITRMISDNLQERLSGGTIRFSKNDITDKWKMKL